MDVAAGGKAVVKGASDFVTERVKGVGGVAVGAVDGATSSINSPICAGGEAVAAWCGAASAGSAGGAVRMSRTAWLITAACTTTGARAGRPL
ncbi:hypothetical protein [Streptomyces sanglieri]|uniref:hypothetical protein n=1 Tax=Streptomyces sanglieri TaxID=193460 RepID=UPI003523187E